MTAPVFVSSRDNALLKELRKLAHENTAYRKAGRIWIEGDHLCRAALQRGLQPVLAVYTESFWATARGPLVDLAVKQVLIPDALFKDISTLESPASMGFVLQLPADAIIQPSAASVILDRARPSSLICTVEHAAAATVGWKGRIADPTTKMGPCSALNSWTPLVGAAQAASSWPVSAP